MKNLSLIVAIVGMTLTGNAQKVLNQLQRNGAADRYPVLTDSLIRGGYQAVPTLADRNAIYPEMRKAGMKVFVLADSTEWRLAAGLTNNDWRPAIAPVTIPTLDQVAKAGRRTDSLLLVKGIGVYDEPADAHVLITGIDGGINISDHVGQPVLQVQPDALSWGGKSVLNNARLKKNREYFMPDSAGIIPLRVNGVGADTSGNIILPAVTVPTLQQVLNAGNSSPLDINVGGVDAAGYIIANRNLGLRDASGNNEFQILHPNTSVSSVKEIYLYNDTPDGADTIATRAYVRRNLVGGPGGGPVIPYLDSVKVKGTKVYYYKDGVEYLSGNTQHFFNTNFRAQADRAHSMAYHSLVVDSIGEFAYNFKSDYNNAVNYIRNTVDQGRTEIGAKTTAVTSPATVSAGVNSEEVQAYITAFSDDATIGAEVRANLGLVDIGAYNTTAGFVSRGVSRMSFNGNQSYWRATTYNRPERPHTINLYGDSVVFDAGGYPLDLKFRGLLSSASTAYKFLVVDPVSGTSYLSTLTPGSGGTPGPAGPQGEKGDKGDPGATGATGAQGLQGIQGVKGDQGVQGVQGPKGDKGDAGNTGSQGAQGLQGEKGDKGDKGDTGTTGATGAQGIQGIQGPKGDTGNTGSQGAQGLQGEKGNKGDPGTAGATGAQGPQGLQGIQGPKGDKGDPGTGSGTPSRFGVAGEDASASQDRSFSFLNNRFHLYDASAIILSAANGNTSSTIDMTDDGINGQGVRIRSNQTNILVDGPEKRIELNAEHGFVMPGADDATIAAISSPFEGQTIFSTDQKKPYYYNSSNWVEFGATPTPTLQQVLAAGNTTSTPIISSSTVQAAQVNINNSGANVSIRPSGTTTGYIAYMPDRTVNSTVVVTESTQSLADGPTVSWNVQAGTNKRVILGGNRTLSITNAYSGMYATLIVEQDGVGSRTLTLPTASKVSNGGAGAVTLTATPGGVDILSFYYDGTNFYWNISKNYN